ncbi:MAG TPA: TolC family protein [Bacteroidetes bacterium]|nr:TolC family protein [Bacteroidota bacterium]
MLLSFFLSTMLFSGSLLAVTEGEPLTLKQVLDIAMRNNPQLQQEKIRAYRARSEQWSGLGFYNPEFTFLKEGIETAGTTGYVEKRLTLRQNIDFPLKSLFRTRQLRAVTRNTEAMVRQRKLELVASIKKAYMQVTYAMKIRKLRQREHTIAEHLVSVSRQRFESGDASEIELLKAELQLLQAKNHLANTENLWHQARYNLFEMMGLTPDEQSYDIAFPDTLYSIDIEVTEDDLLKKIDVMPVYIASQHAIQASLHEKRAALSSWLPDISISVYRQDYGSGYNFFGFEAGFSIPLWFFGNQKIAHSRAEASYRRAHVERSAIRLRMKKEIELAWHRYVKNREILNRYGQDIRERTRKLLQATAEGYELGEVDLLDLLDTQRTWLQSEQHYYDALRDYYFSLIELEQYVDRELVFN